MSISIYEKIGRKALASLGLVLFKEANGIKDEGVAILVGAGVPSGATYGGQTLATGQNALAIDAESASVDALLYGTINGGTNWAAIDMGPVAVGSLTLTTGAMIIGAAGVGSEIDIGGTAQGLPLSDGAGGVTVGTMGDHPATTICGMTRFLNPIAEEYVSIVADVLCADGAQIIAAQPDYPRALAINITIATNPITGGIATVVGVGASGEAVSEDVDITSAVTTIYHTDAAFSTVTSITVSGLAGGAGAGDNIGVGVDSKLGLPGSKSPVSGNFVVYKTVVNDADEAVAGVDATNGTVDPTTAPSGAADFQFYYTFDIAKLAHTIA